MAFDAEFYSTSPPWDKRYMDKWYKNIEVKPIISEYEENISIIFFGNKKYICRQSDICLLSLLTGKMLDYSSRKDDDGILRPTIPIDLEPSFIINSISNFITKIAEKKTDEAFTKWGYLLAIWGMPQHHICLSHQVLANE